MADVTYCINIECPFLDCGRHLTNTTEKPGDVIGIAALDGTCRRYITYLLEEVLKDNGE